MHNEKETLQENLNQQIEQLKVEHNSELQGLKYHIQHFS